jgi:hypothetical protein
MEGGMKIMNLMLIIPGASVLLFTACELPRKAKKVFFKVPTWLSSSVIALGIGVVGRGVLGPSTGFVSELILWPGLAMAKKHFEWSERRLNMRVKKEAKK